MILRLIVHIEKQKGRLPRIRIRRAPYAGQRIFDDGWGWRRLIPCETCSGDGYLDTSEGDWLHRETLRAAFDSSYTPVWIEQNHAVDEDVPLDCRGEPLDAPVLPRNEPLSHEHNAAQALFASMRPGPYRPSESVDSRKVNKALHRRAYQTNVDPRTGSSTIDVHGRSRVSAHYGCSHRPGLDHQGFFVPKS